MTKLKFYDEFFEIKNSKLDESKIVISLKDKNIEKDDDKYKYHYVNLNVDNKDILKFIIADDRPNYASIEINNEKIFIKKTELKELINELQKLIK